MTTSIASEDPWPTAAADPAAALEPGIAARAHVGPRQTLRTILGLLDDAALLLLIALLFPVVILLIGMPRGAARPARDGDRAPVVRSAACQRA